MQNESSKFKMEFNRRLINFSLEIIKLCNEIRKDRNLWAIADQLIRSANSIGANITEAKASSSKLDYLKFFQITLKSANETKYWLVLVIESCPNLKYNSEKLLKEADEIARIIGAGVLTMKGKK
ncbi:MAG: four helix bundle protein [Candidatus Staskawiczbacteria bacterium]|nr:four helix bundle protein [Candidatus Staskawiczbacteria bacterium]